MRPWGTQKSLRSDSSRPNDARSSSVMADGAATSTRVVALPRDALLGTASFDTVHPRRGESRLESDLDDLEFSVDFSDFVGMRG
jgi:hypothetical protein